ncbi:hypothetical protein M427DRAFT_230125 [Gonapodya prolifera JEL478]|uniref:Uncharacterized protein n=1 Tax=Gonapodya prolifera (strain JEL478) TaxID=1344416 RepID=A0A138ZY68_GONPJ|nr:hypothetical protein M427DRAFT_230125 [Gonapodya prolifera JEL478]|eukprot:KXS09439.1 hypothetical protein M427DRAFT_230125 [Gonapodya prolifera JEL478]
MPPKRVAKTNAKTQKQSNSPIAVGGGDSEDELTAKTTTQKQGTVRPVAPKKGKGDVDRKPAVTQERVRVDPPANRAESVAEVKEVVMAMKAADEDADVAPAGGKRKREETGPDAEQMKVVKRKGRKFVQLKSGKYIA